MMYRRRRAAKHIWLKLPEPPAANSRNKIRLVTDPALLPVLAVLMQRGRRR